MNNIWLTHLDGVNHRNGTFNKAYLQITPIHFTTHINSLIVKQLAALQPHFTSVLRLVIVHPTPFAVINH